MKKAFRRQSFGKSFAQLKSPNNSGTGAHKNETKASTPSRQPNRKNAVVGTPTRPNIPVPSAKASTAASQSKTQQSPSPSRNVSRSSDVRTPPRLPAHKSRAHLLKGQDTSSSMDVALKPPIYRNQALPVVPSVDADPVKSMMNADQHQQDQWRSVGQHRRLTLIHTEKQQNPYSPSTTDNIPLGRCYELLEWLYQAFDNVLEKSNTLLASQQANKTHVPRSSSIVDINTLQTISTYYEEAFVYGFRSQALLGTHVLRHDMYYHTLPQELATKRRTNLQKIHHIQICMEEICERLDVIAYHLRLQNPNSGVPGDSPSPNSAAFIPSAEEVLFRWSPWTIKVKDAPPPELLREASKSWSHAEASFSSKRSEVAIMNSLSSNSLNQKYHIVDATSKPDVKDYSQNLLRQNDSDDISVSSGGSLFDSSSRSSDDSSRSSHSSRSSLTTAPSMALGIEGFGRSNKVVVLTPEIMEPHDENMCSNVPVLMEEPRSNTSSPGSISPTDSFWNEEQNDMDYHDSEETPKLNKGNEGIISENHNETAYHMMDDYGPKKKQSPKVTRAGKNSPMRGDTPHPDDLEVDLKSSRPKANFETKTEEKGLDDIPVVAFDDERAFHPDAGSSFFRPISDASCDSSDVAGPEGESLMGSDAFPSKKDNDESNDGQSLDEFDPFAFGGQQGFSASFASASSFPPRDALVECQDGTDRMDVPANDESSTTWAVTGNHQFETDLPVNSVETAQDRVYAMDIVEPPSVRRILTSSSSMTSMEETLSFEEDFHASAQSRLRLMSSGDGVSFDDGVHNLSLSPKAPYQHESPEQTNAGGNIVVEDSKTKTTGAAILIQRQGSDTLTDFSAPWDDAVIVAHIGQPNSATGKDDSIRRDQTVGLPSPYNSFDDSQCWSPNGASSRGSHDDMTPDRRPAKGEIREKEPDVVTFDVKNIVNGESVLSPPSADGSLTAMRSFETLEELSQPRSGKSLQPQSLEKSSDHSNTDGRGNAHSIEKEEEQTHESDTQVAPSKDNSDICTTTPLAPGKVSDETPLASGNHKRLVSKEVFKVDKENDPETTNSTQGQENGGNQTVPMRPRGRASSNFASLLSKFETNKASASEATKAKPFYASSPARKTMLGSSETPEDKAEHAQTPETPLHKDSMSTPQQPINRKVPTSPGKNSSRSLGSETKSQHGSMTPPKGSSFKNGIERITDLPISPKQEQSQVTTSSERPSRDIPSDSGPQPSTFATETSPKETSVPPSTSIAVKETSKKTVSTQAKNKGLSSSFAKAPTRTRGMETTKDTGKKNSSRFAPSMSQPRQMAFGMNPIDFAPSPRVTSKTAPRNSIWRQSEDTGKGATGDHRRAESDCIQYTMPSNDTEIQLQLSAGTSRTATFSSYSSNTSDHSPSSLKDVSSLGRSGSWSHESTSHPSPDERPIPNGTFFEKETKHNVVTPVSQKQVKTPGRPRGSFSNEPILEVSTGTAYTFKKTRSNIKKHIGKPTFLC